MFPLFSLPDRVASRSTAVPFLGAIIVACLSAHAAEANTVNTVSVLNNSSFGGAICRPFEEQVTTSNAYTGHLTTGEDPEQSGRNCRYYTEASAGEGLAAVTNVASTIDLTTQGYTTVFEGRRIELVANATTTTPFFFDVPADSQFDQVAVRPNLLLNASAEARNRDGESTARASLYWAVEFFQVEGELIDFNQGFVSAAAGANLGNQVFEDSLNNFNPIPNGFIVDIDLPLFMRLRLESTVTILNSGAFDESLASINAGDTFSFNPDLPAFDLPDGITVSGPGANVVNNRWTDVRAPIGPSPSPIPLPAGLPLLLAGLGALAMLRRARQ